MFVKELQILNLPCLPFHHRSDFMFNYLFSFNLDNSHSTVLSLYERTMKVAVYKPQKARVIMLFIKRRIKQKKPRRLFNITKMFFRYSLFFVYNYLIYSTYLTKFSVYKRTLSNDNVIRHNQYRKNNKSFGTKKKRRFFLSRRARWIITLISKQLRVFMNSIVFVSKKRQYLVQKNSTTILQRQNRPYLRHLELNIKAAAFTVLPIPYMFFYSFLLDQSHLWRNLLIELHTYSRN